MKKQVIWVMMLLAMPIAFAGYVYPQNYCDLMEDNVTFITECPADHRTSEDWFKIRHYLNNTGESYCYEGELFQPGCSYVLLDWEHPNVVGSPSWQQPSPGMTYSQQEQMVPEFTTIGAALALTGAGYIAYRKRRKV